jgi:hypothetical protein
MARTRTSARNEIFEMLKEDHKRAKKAFRDFAKLDEEGDTQACEALAARTCKELQLHMRLEEDVFYPAARAGLKEEDLVEEAEVEHGSAKALIEKMQALSGDDPKFAATFTVLGEYIKHHVKEEENEMFEQLGRAKVDWEGVLEEMLAHRMELEAELGLAAEDAEDEAAADLALTARQVQGRTQAKAARRA